MATVTGSVEVKLSWSCPQKYGTALYIRLIDVDPGSMAGSHRHNGPYGSLSQGSGAAKVYRLPPE